MWRVPGKIGIHLGYETSFTFSKPLAIECQYAVIFLPLFSASVIDNFLDVQVSSPYTRHIQR
jgi:hypothetical protein